MASFRNTCEHCRTGYTAYNSRSRFCRDSCRVAAHRDAKAKRENAALDLLARQSAALAAGADPAVLASLAREAQRLLERV